MFLKFISDVLHDDMAQRAFAKNPQEEMDRAGLSAHQRHAVLSRDHAKILYEIGESLHSSGPKLRWPAPALAVTSISPTSGAQGETVNVTIQGSYFVQASDITVDLDGVSNQSPVSVKVLSVTGVGTDASTIEGTVALPATMIPASYTVRVTRTTDDVSATLPTAFLVTG